MIEHMDKVWCNPLDTKNWDRNTLLSYVLVGTGLLPESAIEFKKDRNRQLETMRSAYLRRGSPFVEKSPEQIIAQAAAMLEEGGDSVLFKIGTASIHGETRQYITRQGGESVWLDGGSWWDLHMDGNGEAYISNNKEYKYVSEILPTQPGAHQSFGSPMAGKGHPPGSASAQPGTGGKGWSEAGAQQKPGLLGGCKGWSDAGAQQSFGPPMGGKAHPPTGGKGHPSQAIAQQSFGSPAGGKGHPSEAGAQQSCGSPMGWMGYSPGCASAQPDAQQSFGSPPSGKGHPSEAGAQQSFGPPMGAGRGHHHQQSFGPPAELLSPRADSESSWEGAGTVNSDVKQTYFMAEDQDGRQILVEPSSKRARILHRAQSDGADDWEVFTHYNGDQYIASRQKMKPPRWIDQLFKAPPPPEESQKADHLTTKHPSMIDEPHSSALSPGLVAPLASEVAPEVASEVTPLSPALSPAPRTPLPTDDVAQAAVVEEAPAASGEDHSGVPSPPLTPLAEDM